MNYFLNEIEFEWDDKKASENLKKHSISFETACEVFFDPFLKVEDAGTVEKEHREAVIGLTMSWKLLYVVYVMRNDIIRIISARLATNFERKDYEN